MVYYSFDKKRKEFFGKRIKTIVNVELIFFLIKGKAKKRIYILRFNTLAHSINLDIPLHRIS